MLLFVSRAQPRLCVQALLGSRSRTVRTFPTLRNESPRSPALPTSESPTNKPSNAPLDSSPAENPPDTGAPLEFLSRPLGVSEVPSALPKSWAARREELLDREKHLEKRRHL